MKIFKFNPITGQRGELIGNKKRAGYASEGIGFAMKHGLEAIEVKLPNKSNEEWIAHVDAGMASADVSKDVSYLTDEWICFCTGQYTHNKVWNWIVLPPKHLVEKYNNQ